VPVAIPDLEELRARVVGVRLPGGSFQVPEYERWLSHDAMLAPPLPDGVLHPVWILLGVLRGMGTSIEDLVGLVDADPEDGVLFGETTLDQHTPLRAGVAYAVTGRVTDVQRRTGRRAGTMDLLTFELTVHEPAGTVAAVSVQTFIILRSEPDHGA
jgi:hypothetical protein